MKQKYLQLLLVLSATKKAQCRQAQTHLFSALVESCSGQVEALCLC